MFERFTHDARAAVTYAEAQAQVDGADHVGTERVLLGMTIEPSSVAARALAELGVDRDRVVAAVRALPSDSIDAEALAGLGIDLEAVRTSAERTFGEGALDDLAPRAGRRRKPLAHVPFDPSSKKLLELALREAIRVRHNRIDSGHLLLAVTRMPDCGAYRALWDTGVSAEAVRGAVERVWAAAA
ncbi:Clp protease N-terminal domain-containing protein [Cellulomonas alba]|uniref:Clp protease N-terminal domain-containing protein n=1 Tax=Cellulomonas alba TaxID=3053467 RepID=A0ABT7SDM7_9CELL|nr:Clp protease N-terminal domain-containing protein [Cellulomonas alba]MDM7854236.1 Clp protease N-terminal domain-containing protein [Cellulomonas alba]